VEASGLAARCAALPSRPATDAELARAHDSSYVRAVDEVYRPGATLSPDGGVAPLEEGGDAILISGDMYCNPHTPLAARTAAGCAVEVGAGIGAGVGSGRGRLAGG
jgi:acetoin utilization deacetylase AcuC-like enzyme